MLGLLLALAIPFLPSAPVVDGRLDRNLERLPDHVFPDSGIHWRIAYGTDFLYLYLDVPKARMENRDRAYQNGDGFHLVLAKPSAEAEGSREFVVLGFSPMAASAARQRAFTWYRNVDLAFRSLEGSQLATATAGSNTGIELVLPWRDVYPFHPWFMDGIGFNLCYVEAIGVGEKKLLPQA